MLLKHAKVISFILRHLTWTRISIVLIILSLISGIFVLSGKKNGTRESAGALRIQVSSELKDRIVQANQNDPDIVGIQVITLNFHQNIIIESYIDIDDLYVKSLYDKYTRERVYEAPIFTNTPENDSRTLRILAGRLHCTPFTASAAHRYIPELGRVIKTVCAVTVPPNSSDVLGFLVIYLNKEISTNKEQLLAHFSRELATKLYEENKDIFRVDRNKR